MDAGEFFDPEDRTKPPRIVLIRGDDNGREYFRLERSVGYCDREFGEIIVPGERPGYTTDLTSVPDMLTWLVPKSGPHLPAALIHDGLIEGSYIVAPPRVLTWQESDLVFRHGLADLGINIVRRWVMWCAVSLGTIWRSGRLPARAGVVVWAATIGVLGFCATLDLFWNTGILFWMRSDDIGVRFFWGAIGAFAIPAIGSIFWLRRWRIGIISGISLALLLHVTGAVVFVSYLFFGIEEIAQKRFVAAARKFVVPTFLLIVCVFGWWVVRTSDGLGICLPIGK